MASTQQAKQAQVSIEWIAGAVLFAAFVVAHLFFDASAAIKVLGVGTLFTGTSWIVRKAVPIGIESRRPSLYARGWLPILMGLSMIVLGTALILKSSPIACILGWASNAICE